jgi:cyclic pyranopterin phosphate synthase
MQPDSPLIDRYDRRVNYLRLSVTDRCDFRCVYCMSEKMTFLPKKQVLSLEELYSVGRAFTELGVTKIRLTGGEPLVRRNIIWLVEQLAALPGLKELTLTSNGSQLPKMAADLHKAGLGRINISMDSLREDRFKKITRTGDLNNVIAGIDAASAAGFTGLKLNTVIMRDYNDDEVMDLVHFVIERGMDISFIEEMPLGTIDDHDRADSYFSSDEIRDIIIQQHELLPSTANTGGPSRYWSLAGTSSKVGFISPHSHNFCESCNRVRVTVQGRLLLCLGQEHSVDLMQILRENPDDDQLLKQAIRDSMDIKPKGHDFDLNRKEVIFRHMSVTGG